MDSEEKWKNAYDFLTMDGEFPDEYIPVSDAALLVDFLDYLAEAKLLREARSNNHQTALKERV